MFIFLTSSMSDEARIPIGSFPLYPDFNAFVLNIKWDFIRNYSSGLKSILSADP